MDNSKYYLTSAKVSAQGWRDQLAAAEVVRQVVANMVQVFAEADEYNKLGVKRAIIEDSMVVYSLPELTAALETLRTDHRGTKLASYYHDLASWFTVLRKCRSFKEWDECRANFIRIRSYYHNHWASVVHNAGKFAAHFEQLAEQYRSDVSKLAASKLPAISLSKEHKKAIVHTMVAAEFGRTFSINKNLYFYAAMASERKAYATRGFTMTYKIWNHAMLVRAMYPRC